MDLRYLDIKSIDDLKLVINYMMSFKQGNLVNQIFSNPSIDYFYGFDEVIEKIYNKNYSFYLNKKNHLIITDSNAKKVYEVSTEFLKDAGTYAIRVNIKNHIKVNIFPNEESIVILKIIYNDKLFSSQIDNMEYMIFDEYGLESRYLKVKGKSILSISRDESGYMATACLTSGLDHEPIIKTYNIDTNTPLLEFSKGRLVDEVFLKKNNQLTVIDEDEIASYLEANTKYLSKKSKDRLFEMYRNKEKDDKKLK